MAMKRTLGPICLLVSKRLNVLINYSAGDIPIAFHLPG